jgi:PAS domain-containing protein
MSEVETLQRRLERERQARKQAEKLAEEKTLELFQANQALRLLNEHLEEAVQEATRELQDALRSLSTIMANLVDGLLVTDTVGNITHFNPALLAMFGLGGADLTGRACQAFFSDQIATLIAQTQ